MNNSFGEMSGFNEGYVVEPGAKGQRLSYFVLTILGFSFWFLMAVPFASHRESYWWLAKVHSQHVDYAFTFISSTYRPLAAATTWLGFMFLDPGVFPTSVPRQALFQFLMYGMFVLAWWLIYSAAVQRRLFALTAFVVGGVFFSGYVHLFHIYGIFYVPVILILGAVLRAHAIGTFSEREVRFAVVATLLVFWHPFATALFIGFYFGYYLDTFKQRNRAQHAQAAAILFIGIAAIVALIIALPRLWPGASAHLVQTATRPLDTRLIAFLVSYQTNEVNGAASLAAFVLAQMVVLSMGLSPKLRLMALLAVSALSVAFLSKGVPLLLLWVCLALIKLLLLRYWSLFFLAVTAVLLPFGGGIGSPIYALFAIIIAIYVTALGWSRADEVLSFVKPRYILGTAVAAAAVVLMVRAGMEVPIITKVAHPLLAERERTYQLESILAWLRDSDYCGYELDFAERADSPIDSVESAITRRNRPPSALDDVRLFWKTALQCKEAERSKDTVGTAIVTFGGSDLAASKRAFKVKGRYGGDASVWIADSK